MIKIYCRNEWKIPSEEIIVVKEGKGFQSRMTVNSHASQGSFAGKSTRSSRSNKSGGIEGIGALQDGFKAGKADHLQ